MMTLLPNTTERFTNTPFFKGPFIGLPVSWNMERADQVFRDLDGKLASLSDGDLRDRLAMSLADPSVRDVLSAIFSNSPFLTRCALSDLSFLQLVLEQGPDTALCNEIDEIKDALSGELDADRLKRGLRIARKRTALLVALADITGTWSLERLTQALSDFADAATSAALSHLLLMAANNNEIVLVDEYFPEYECGYFALAMGKYGARELNYSSDIDLIILYDPVKIDYRGRNSLQQFLAKITRAFVSVLQDNTADGYVFRVDLRLRPDPGSTPAAIPYANALRYYESRGEGWERAAMIKARPALGDLLLGRQFLGELEPFVWRPSVDFWTQREIAKIKRRMNQRRGKGEIRFLGHNIKVGRGGIREIEFFAQAHQLVYGGRDAYLRSTRTLDALSTLAEAGHVSEETADELTEAYEFLRQLEHRLQMINDQQTQTLPMDETDVRHVVAFMGYEDMDVFRSALLNYLQLVAKHFSSVMQDSGEALDERYSAFMLMRGDPNELGVLEEIGFSDGKNVLECLQRWQGATYKSMRDSRSPELITELAPRIIEAAAKSYNPDFTLQRFDTLLSNLKGGVNFFSCLLSNQAAFDFVFEILGPAPKLIEELAGNPQKLQAMLSSDGFEETHDPRVLMAECANIAKAQKTSEAFYASVALWAAEQRFRVAAQTVRHVTTWNASGCAYADIADAVITSVFQYEHQGRKIGGTTSAPPIVVVGTGRYGARAMTHGAAVDLIFFCKEDPAEIPAIPDFCRRLLLRLVSLSPEGEPLNVCLGSTPYATRAPIVTQIGPFLSFCQEVGNALSLLTLPQARVIFGPDWLMEEFDRDLKAFIASGQAWYCLSTESEEVLQKLRATTATRCWDLQHCRGGLHELEALIVFLQIRASKLNSDVLALSGGRALAKLVALGELDRELGKQLIEAHHLLRQAENFLSAAAGNDFETEVPHEVRAPLARACGLECFRDLEDVVNNAKVLVGATLDRILTHSG